MATDAVSEGVHVEKKDIFALWVFTQPASTLRASSNGAQSIIGPRMILAMAPCPTSWSYDPKDTDALRRLAVRRGLWPLKEYRDERVTHT